MFDNAMWLVKAEKHGPLMQRQYEDNEIQPVEGSSSAAILSCTIQHAVMQ